MEEKKNSNAMMLYDKKEFLTKVLKSNNYSTRFGLTLSSENALQLFETRKEVLREERRVEFGTGIMEQMIFTFCDSPYIEQEHYTEILEALMEVFYHYKNESKDLLTDDELLTFMKKSFDGEAAGSIEYLRNTALYRYVRKIKMERQGY